MAHGLGVRNDGLFGAWPNLGVGVLTANGLPDHTFSPDGSASVPVSEAVVSSDVVVGPGEQLLVSGTRYSPNPDFLVAAFRTDGSTDTAFGAGGLVTTSIGDGADRDRVGGMVLTDNKIVVAGSSAPSEGESGFVAARYLLPGGQPDPLFSVDGRTFTDFGWVATGQGAAPGAAVEAVVAESDGRVVLGGTSPQGWTLVRYLPNGTPDASFGADGIVGLKRLDDGQLRNLVVQGNALLASGTTFEQNRSRITIVRLAP